MWRTVDREAVKHSEERDDGKKCKVLFHWRVLGTLSETRIQEDPGTPGLWEQVRGHCVVCCVAAGLRVNELHAFSFLRPTESIPLCGGPLSTVSEED